jgi:two-component system, NarL family, nitrate/nitrite response regulator NarL
MMLTSHLGFCDEGYSLSSSQPSAIRVLIVAENPFARAGLATLLAQHTLLLVVGQSDGSRSFVDDAALFQPDVILWDVNWDVGILQQRVAELRECDVPILAMIADDDHAPALLGAGVRGLLLQRADINTIVLALQALTHQLVVVSTDFTLSPSMLSTTMSAAPTLDALTGREMEVLRLVAEGLPNKQIALRLAISEHTVKFHINAIMGKLSVQSRTEAVVRATRAGLIAL